MIICVMCVKIDFQMNTNLFYMLKGKKITAVLSNSLNSRVHNKKVDVLSVRNENQPLNDFFSNPPDSKIMYRSTDEYEKISLCMPPFGLINAKYNCYMNSLMQCYLSIDQFVQYFQ